MFYFLTDYLIAIFLFWEPTSPLEFQESQLAKVIEKNTELTIANSDLQKKVVELHGVSEECLTLKTTLVSLRNDFCDR